MTKKSFQLSVGDKEYKIDVEQFDGKRAQVKVDGKPYEVEVRETQAEAGKPAPSSEVRQPIAAPARPGIPEPPQAPTRSVPSGGQVVAPMPGLILDIMVSPGDVVAAGTPVVNMEAMKMENQIPSPVGGTVKTIAVKVGDNVLTDQILVVIE